MNSKLVHHLKNDLAQNASSKSIKILKAHFLRHLTSLPMTMSCNDTLWMLAIVIAQKYYATKLTSTMKRGGDDEYDDGDDEDIFQYVPPSHASKKLRYGDDGDEDVFQYVPPPPHASEKLRRNDDALQPLPQQQQTNKFRVPDSPRFSLPVSWSTQSQPSPSSSPSLSPSVPGISLAQHFSLDSPPWNNSGGNGDDSNELTEPPTPDVVRHDDNNELTEPPTPDIDDDDDYYYNNNGDSDGDNADSKFTDSPSLEGGINDNWLNKQFRKIHDAFLPYTDALQRRAFKPEKYTLPVIRKWLRGVQQMAIRYDEIFQIPRSEWSCLMVGDAQQFGNVHLKCGMLPHKFADGRVVLQKNTNTILLHADDDGYAYFVGGDENQKVYLWSGSVWLHIPKIPVSKDYYQRLVAAPAPALAIAKVKRN